MSSGHLLFVASNKRNLDAAFGKVLKRMRQRSGFSQETLASKANLHRTYISLLERGLKSPSLGVLATLAAVLGVEVWKMLREVKKDD